MRKELQILIARAERQNIPIGVYENKGNILVMFDNYGIYGQDGRKEVAELNYNIFVPIEKLVEFTEDYLCSLELEGMK